MRPNGKVVFIDKDKKSDKKMMCFWVDPRIYDYCVKSHPCRLIQEGELVAGGGLATEVVTALAIECWRLEKRLNKISDMMKEKIGSDSESVFDQVQRIRDLLAKHEIEVKEYTGQSYNDGMTPRVLHFEKDESLPEGVSTIVETIRPTIYLKGNVISHGEVIVARSKEK